MPQRLPPNEERFLRYYVQLGGVDEHIRGAEKKARLKVGSGATLLKKKRVQDALKERMEPIRLEQERQRLVGDAVREATAKQQEELDALKAEAARLKSLPAINIQGNTTLLEQELMRVALGLDMNLHGRVKLEYIKTALVIGGLMEQGTTRRVGPTESHPGGSTPSVYASVFERLRLASSGAAEGGAGAPAVPVAPNEPPLIDGVFDLMPAKVQPVVPVPVAPVMPRAGDPISPAAKQPVPANAGVLTVEVG